MLAKHFDLSRFSDRRGKLTVAQEGDHIPFQVKRLFILSEVSPGSSRGDHAHHQQHQYFIMMAGSCIIDIDDGHTVQSYVLSGLDSSLHVPPMHWVTLHAFSPGAVCCVLTSDVYDNNDYIRDYEEFRALAGDRVERAALAEA